MRKLNLLELVAAASFVEVFLDMSWNVQFLAHSLGVQSPSKQTSQLWQFYTALALICHWY